MNKTGTIISYKYNDSGIRTQKTVNGVATNYYMDGANVIYETKGSDTFYYTYDAGGNLISFNLNGAEYYYVRNGQNDIIGLLDNTGAKVANYVYDSWGKLISIKDANGNIKTTDTTFIGYKNPYRYRGYRYDSETALYYLQSRYYDPEWGRFINADTIDSTIENSDDLLSTNLFAYCTNNPVNHVDEDGQWKLPNWAKIGIGAVALTAAVALTISSGGALAPLLIGVAVSTGLGAAGGYLKDGKKGAIDGACSGFMVGGIFACASAGVSAIKAAQATKCLSYTSGTPNAVGKIGEKLSGIIKNTKSFRMASGNMRIPDGLTKNLLQEVKNVKSLSLTSQLKDYMQFAKSTGRTMELFVRPDTYMSGPLKQAIAQYGVQIKYLW